VIAFIVLMLFLNALAAAEIVGVERQEDLAPQNI
jgi:hypothetical protein